MITYNKCFVEKWINILIVLMLVCLFFNGFLVDLGVPSYIKYNLDLLNIALFVLTIPLILKRTVNITFFFLGIYFIIITIGSVVFVTNQPLDRCDFFLWAVELRALIRFPIFFIIIYNFKELVRVNQIMSCVLKFHCINTVYIIWQYFYVVPPYSWMRGDVLNGFFGVWVGGNTFVNVLLMTVSVIVLNKLKRKEMSRLSTYAYLLSCFFISALIELKVFFVELLLILFLYNLCWFRRKFKTNNKEILITLATVSLSIIVFYGMIELLYVLYPIFAGSMTVENILRIISSSEGYTGAGDFNRLTAVYQSYDLLLHRNLWDSIWGLGIGNVSTSFYMSEFAQMYNDTTHYSWFMSSYIFLQNGLIGLILYLSTFIYVCFNSIKKHSISFVTFSTSVMTIVLFFYGEALKTEVAYILYMFMAIGMNKNICVSRF